MITAPGGLRQRKKQKTREAIQREAMRLFAKQGYAATTIEQIAEAAEISPSTFFNYFPTKEDVVIYDRYDPLMVATILARPVEESFSAALRHTLVEVMGEIFKRDHEMILARARLSLQAPELRARIWEELERTQGLLRSVIAQRTGRDPNDFALRVEVMIVITAMFVAAMEWTENDGQQDFLELCNRALDIAEAGARLDDIAR